MGVDFQNGNVRKILFCQGSQTSLPSAQFFNHFPCQSLSIRKEKKKKKRKAVGKTD
jgi:hypothetical protein